MDSRSTSPTVVVATTPRRQQGNGLVAPLCLLAVVSSFSHGQATAAAGTAAASARITSAAFVPSVLVRSTAGSTADFRPSRTRSAHRYGTGFVEARVSIGFGADGEGGDAAPSGEGGSANIHRNNSHGLRADTPGYIASGPETAESVVAPVAVTKRVSGTLPATWWTRGLPKGLKWMDTVRRRMLTKEDWLHVHAASSLVREKKKSCTCPTLRN